MRISNTLVYFLIFTVISSFVAYRLVMASYDNYDYGYVDAEEVVVPNPTLQE